MKKLILFLSLVFTFGTAYSLQRPEPTKINGSIHIGTRNNHIAANLEIKYVPQIEAVSNISLYLTKDVIIQRLLGDKIKSYSFNKDNKKIPFGTLVLEFNTPLKLGEEIIFSLTYSGTSSKGFFTKNYNWVDIDPDFMILPAFTDLHPFDYEIEAYIDNPDYKFVDAKNGAMASTLLTKASSANYFASIVAGSDLQFKKYTDDDFSVNIISNKEKNIVNKMGIKSLEILKYFNRTIGKKKQVNNFSVLYRPMAVSVFPTNRNINHVRLIMFTNDHEQLPTLVHEVSHFWWNRGNDFTMEKWLQESFAQYSKLMYLRDTEGQEKFKESIEELKNAAVNLPPLLGYDRFGSNWSSMLYVKGPYLLYQLEQKISAEKFLQFLNELNAQETATTKHLLEVLEKVAGRESKEWFYKKLNS